MSTAKYTRKLPDYSPTFGKVRFTTRHKLTLEEIEAAVWALGCEIGENLVYDHYHPEIAGPLQLASHFLLTRATRPAAGELRGILQEESSERALSEMF